MSKSKEYRRLVTSTRWRILRSEKLSEQPLCEKCEKEGRVRLAEEVHHIRPIESSNNIQEMNILAFDRSNLMSVCRDCHHKIHNEMESKSKKAIAKNNERRTRSFISKFFK